MIDSQELRATSAVAGGESSPRNELAAELRHLKESSALSFARLGSKTHTSKSSLERYLNGKLMPPRQIVAAISDTCGGDTDRILKLRDRAAGFDDPGRADLRRADPGESPAHRRRPGLGPVFSALLLLPREGRALEARPERLATQISDGWSRRRRPIPRSTHTPCYHCA